MDKDEVEEIEGKLRQFGGGKERRESERNEIRERRVERDYAYRDHQPERTGMRVKVTQG